MKKAEWRRDLAEIKDMARWLMVQNRIKPDTAKRLLDICDRLLEQFEEAHQTDIFREVASPGAWSRNPHVDPGDQD